MAVNYLREDFCLREVVWQLLGMAEAPTWARLFSEGKGLKRLHLAVEWKRIDLDEESGKGNPIALANVSDLITIRGGGNKFPERA